MLQRYWRKEGISWRGSRIEGRRLVGDEAGKDRRQRNHAEYDQPGHRQATAHKALGDETQLTLALARNDLRDFLRDIDLCDDIGLLQHIHTEAPFCQMSTRAPGMRIAVVASRSSGYGDRQRHRAHRRSG